MIDRPKNAASAFLDAWNARDADALAALFVDEPDFVNVVGTWWRNADEVRRAHASAFDTVFWDKRLAAGQVTVKHLSPDVATVHMEWRLGAGAKAGAGAERRGILLFVVRRVDGGWLIQTAQNTESLDHWPPGDEVG